MFTIITIDGPAGTGKSTIAKELAQQLQYNHIDTGAMYRAVAYAYLQEGLFIDEISKLFTFKQLSFFLKDGELTCMYKGLVLTKELRSKETTQTSSALSQLDEVRSQLIQIQREFAKEGNAVFEGRDIGSIVFPDANFKFFLIASIEERVNRRAKQLEIANNQSIDRDQLFMEISQRDQADQERTLSPLVRPKNSFLIDTSSLTISQILEKILTITTQIC
ncbi:(d)CMP kinase [Candidatus Clavichlamydia salmonicola]|uniref:(d)CMP kinase n=1 Tax=Candidatus Clavichlamydia salmonicola TaxID=469812 RepID=UPI001891EB9A|nr:(d)CMP kinase [Candidatus Clavichlamydia salmonicola]